MNTMPSREQLIETNNMARPEELNELFEIEKKFPIEFNICQLQSAYNRSWGKSYLSWSIALYRLLTEGETYAGYLYILDEDVETSRSRKIMWIKGLQNFAISVGYRVHIREDAGMNNPLLKAEKETR